MSVALAYARSIHVDLPVAVNHKHPKVGQYMSCHIFEYTVYMDGLDGMGCQILQPDVAHQHILAEGEVVPFPV